MKLFRYFHNTQFTLGLLKINEEHPPIFTLELPWRNNERDVSCIPAGVYTVKPYKSPKFKTMVYQVLGVDDRDDIEIHVGNYTKNTTGCILPGLSVNASAPMIVHSTRAMEMIDDLLERKKTKIEISYL